MHQVLLNEATDFEGGGTCFAKPARLRAWADGGRALLSSAAAAAGSGGEEAGGEEDGGEEDGGEEDGGEEEEAGRVRLMQGSRGDCVVHSGQCLHGAASVTAGTRFVLVCFVREAE